MRYSFTMITKPIKRCTWVIYKKLIEPTIVTVIIKIFTRNKWRKEQNKKLFDAIYKDHFWKKCQTLYEIKTMLDYCMKKINKKNIQNSSETKREKSLSLIHWSMLLKQ